MKKKLLFGILCLITLGLLTGCSLSKKVLTTKDFISKAEDQGFIITDVKEQFKDVEHVKEATVASSPKGWQIEFYVLTTEDKAKEMFEKNKADFEAASSGIIIENNMINYNYYSKENDDYYMFIERVENTVVYAKVPAGQKDEVKKIVKNIGY